MGIFIYMSDPDQHDIIQLRLAFVVLDKKNVGKRY